MNTAITERSVVEAANRLVDLIRDARVESAFTKGGCGPLAALVDDTWSGKPGPIRQATERLRQALLDHDRACLAKETA